MDNCEYYTLLTAFRQAHTSPTILPPGDCPPLQRLASATPRHFPPLATSIVLFAATLRPPPSLLARQFLRFFAFLMSLSLSVLIRPSMRSIQLALYRQAAPGRPLLPFGGSGFTVRSPMRLSALANRGPCSVSPSASYASDNPSASSLSFSTQIQLNR